MILKKWDRHYPLDSIVFYLIYLITCSIKFAVKSCHYFLWLLSFLLPSPPPYLRSSFLPSLLPSFFSLSLHPSQPPLPPSPSLHNCHHMNVFMSHLIRRPSSSFTLISISFCFLFRPPCFPSITSQSILTFFVSLLFPFF